MSEADHEDKPSVSGDDTDGQARSKFRKQIGKAGKKLANVARQRVMYSPIHPSDCDIVIQFPKESKQYTIEWFCDLAKRSNDGLDIKVAKHEATGRINLLCSCTYLCLLKSAEELHLKKKLKPEYGGQPRDFFLEDEHLYAGCSDPKTFFTSQERVQLVLYNLRNLRFTEDTKIQGDEFSEGQPVVPQFLALGIIKQVFPIHSTADLNYLRTKWVFDFTARQPLDAVKDYFGTHIAMYFTFLGHYTCGLFLPALVGVIIWAISGVNQTFDDIAFVLFALLNVVWSTVYIESWKRKQAAQAYRWGTIDKQDDLISEPRTFYKGDLKESPVTGRMEPHFPAWKRNLFFYSVSVPVIMLCHCVIVLVCFNFFTFYDVINEKVNSGELYVVFRPLPNIFLAVAVMVMDKIYGMIAVWLNDKENYRTEEEYQNQLIIKLTLFQSVNSFLSLFYTAFYIQDFNRLRNQLAILFVVRQVVGNMKESLLSFFIAKAKQYQGAKGSTGKELLRQLKEDCKSTSILNVEKLVGLHKDKDSGSEASGDEGLDTDEQKVKAKKSRSYKAELTQAEAEGLLPSYDGTFEDYLEMVIQFSYVTWFSSVFPLAGLFALLNNFIEIRSDAFKLCMSYQRPIGERVRDIGAWHTVLEVMSIGTIIVNTALIGLSGPMQRMFPKLDHVERILLIVAMEHVVLVIKMIIKFAISDIPEWIRVEMAKLEFNRREALRHRIQDYINQIKDCQEIHQARHYSSDSDSEDHDDHKAHDDAVVEQSATSSIQNSPQTQSSELRRRPVAPSQSALGNVKFPVDDAKDDNTEVLVSELHDEL